MVDQLPRDPMTSDDLLQQTKLTPWQIRRNRLRLAWNSFKKNWKLFAENKIGLVGLTIIGIFGVMAFAHPILRATVWSEVRDGIEIYDPVLDTFNSMLGPYGGGNVGPAPTFQSGSTMPSVTPPGGLPYQEIVTYSGVSGASSGGTAST